MQSEMEKLRVEREELEAEMAEMGAHANAEAWVGAEGSRECGKRAILCGEGAVAPHTLPCDEGTTAPGSQPAG